MATPSVNVGRKSGRIFIVSTYAPGRGTYVDNEPVFVVASNDTEAIGQRILEALEAFVDGGRMPDWKVYRSPVLNAAGFTTWSEYEQGLRECVITRHEDHFHIMTKLPHLRLPRNATPDEIGNAVLTALGTSKEKEARRRR